MTEEEYRFAEYEQWAYEQRELERKSFEAQNALIAALGEKCKIKQERNNDLSNK